MPPAADESARGVAPNLLGIVRDGLGDLWLRPDRPDLLRYRGGRLESVPFATGPREVAVTAMTVGRGGELLLFAQVSGLLVRRGERFERVAIDPPPGSVVLSMAQAADGTLFLGTRDSGLVRLRDGVAVPIADGLPDRKVNCLLAVGDRDLWVGTDRGVVRWNGAALTHDGVPEPLRGVQVLTLVRDREGNVWAGTGHGLVRANAQGAAALDPRTAAGGAVTALFQDRERALWVGDGAGLERLHDAPFATYGRTQGLPAEGGGAVHVDRGDRAWFAPPDGGLYVVEGERVERIAIGGADHDRVYSIAAARDGLWLGRHRGGLTHLRFEGATFRVPQLRRGGRSASFGRLRGARRTRRQRVGGHAQRRPQPPARGAHRDLHDRERPALQQRQHARRQPGRHALGGHARRTRGLVAGRLDDPQRPRRAAVRQRERAPRGLAGRAVDRHRGGPGLPAVGPRRGSARRAGHRCASRWSGSPRARAAGCGSPPPAGSCACGARACSTPRSARATS